MKHKTADLKGALLDAAVAKAEDTKPHKVLTSVTFDADTPPTFRMEHLPYSRSWQQGGPIIERERVELRYSSADWWGASIFSTEAPASHRRGQTPLIAAMRAYVASKFGDEVEL